MECALKMFGIFTFQLLFRFWLSKPCHIVGPALGASGTFGASTTFGPRVGPGPMLELSSDGGRFLCAFRACSWVKIVQMVRT